MNSARDDQSVRWAVLLRGAFCLLLAATGALSAADPKGEEFFERRIRPVLVRECYACHSSAAPEVKGGLRVDSRAAIRAGGGQQFLDQDVVRFVFLHRRDEIRGHAFAVGGVVLVHAARTTDQRPGPEVGPVPGVFRAISTGFE